MKFDISVILLTKNGGIRLRHLMESLKKQKFQGNVEIIAVDSGSEDNTIKILEEYEAKIFQINPEEFHHSKTRNFGAEKSNGKVLIYLTQDALPLNDHLFEDLLKPLTKDNASATYGRQIANLDAKKVDKFFYSYFYPEKRKILKKRLIKNPRKFYIENVFISDVCSAIKREIWEKIGFQDDVPMAEDKDFALRVLKAGYKIVYEPKAAVYHSHNYTLASLFKRRFKDGGAFSNIALQGEGNFVKKGLNYFIEEIKFFLRNKYFAALIYALVYNFVYFFGFQLGTYEKKIPNFIKDKISE